MNFFDLNFWQGFVGNLLATIIGVAIGIPVAFWINRRVEFDKRKEKINKIYDSLEKELIDNYKLLSQWEQSGGNTWLLTTIGAKMKNEIWNAFSDGGELEWIDDPETLASLAETYSYIGQVKYFSDKYINFNSMDESTAKYIFRDLIDAMTHAKTQIESFRKVLTYVRIVLKKIQ